MHKILPLKSKKGNIEIHGIHINCLFHEENELSNISFMTFLMQIKMSYQLTALQTQIPYTFKSDDKYMT